MRVKGRVEVKGRVGVRVRGEGAGIRVGVKGGSEG